MSTVNKKLEDYLLPQIESALEREAVSYVLNLINFAYEKKLFNTDFFELFFIQTFHLGSQNNGNIIPQYIEQFGLTPIRAGQLIQSYIKYELNGKSILTSSSFLIVDKIIEAVFEGIIFDSEFLLEEMVHINLDNIKHKELINKNNENNALWLSKTLEITLINKEYINNVSKI
jgi:hypothetical protein